MRVLLADDHTMVRASLVGLLQAEGDVQVVAQAANGVEAIEQALKTRPEVVVTDLSMGALNGLEVIRRLRTEIGAAGVQRPHRSQQFRGRRARWPSSCNTPSAWSTTRTAR